MATTVNRDRSSRHSMPKSNFQFRRCPTILLVVGVFWTSITSFPVANGAANNIISRPTEGKIPLPNPKLQLRRQLQEQEATPAQVYTAATEDAQEVISYCPAYFITTGNNVYRDEFADTIFAMATEYILYAHPDERPTTLTFGVSASLRAELLDVGEVTGVHSQQGDIADGTYNSEYYTFLPDFHLLPSEIINKFIEYVCDNVGDEETDTVLYCNNDELRENYPEDLPRLARIPMSNLLWDDRRTVITELCKELSESWADLIVFLEDYWIHSFSSVMEQLDDWKTSPATISPLQNNDDSDIDLSVTFIVRVIDDDSITTRMIQRAVRVELSRLVDVELSRLQDAETTTGDRRSRVLGSHWTGQQRFISIVSSSDARHRASRGGNNDRNHNSVRNSNMRKNNRAWEEADKSTTGNGQQDSTTADKARIVPELVDVDVHVVVRVGCDPPPSNSDVRCYLITSKITLDPKRDNPDELRKRVAEAVQEDQTPGAYLSNLDIFVGLTTTPEDYLVWPYNGKSSSTKGGTGGDTTHIKSKVSLVIFIVVFSAVVGLAIQYYDGIRQEQMMLALEVYGNDHRLLPSSVGHGARRGRDEGAAGAEVAEWYIFYSRKKQFRDWVIPVVDDCTDDAAGGVPSFRMKRGGESA